MNQLSAMVYRSRTTFPLSDVDLFYLLAQARLRNKQLGLSGLLLYDRGHFFQWLEGANKPLGTVWNSIRSDARHREIQVLADQQIPVRLFEEWHMQFAHRDKQHGGVVDGFVVADPAVLDDLHLNPHKVPSILASFSSLGGTFSTARA